MYANFLKLHKESNMSLLLVIVVLEGRLLRFLILAHVHGAAEFVKMSTSLQFLI